MEKIPGYLKVEGGVLLLFPAIQVLGVLLEPATIEGASVTGVVINVVATILLLLSGGGLLIGRRWAWPMAVVIAVILLATGVVIFRAPGDIAHPGQVFIAFWLLVAGTLLLVGLFTRKTIGWLRRSPGRA